MEGTASERSGTGRIPLRTDVDVGVEVGVDVDVDEAVKEVEWPTR
jgi:hypothetical protein